MSQHLLATKLQEKLGFTVSSNQVQAKRLATQGESKRIKKRHTPKGSVQLEPPDRFIKSPALLKFNLREKKIYQEQIQKVQLETGLEPRLQVDLRICHLDRETARLIFYSYRFAEITHSEGTIGMACDYLAQAKAAIPPPLSPEIFWTTARLKYRGYVKRLKTKIEGNRSHADDSRTLECINDFLKYLSEKWGV